MTVFIRYLENDESYIFTLQLYIVHIPEAERATSRVRANALTTTYQFIKIKTGGAGALVLGLVMCQKYLYAKIF